MSDQDSDGAADGGTEISYEMRLTCDSGAMDAFDNHPSISALRAMRVPSDDASGGKHNALLFVTHVLAASDPERAVPCTALMGAAAAIATIASQPEPLTTEMLLAWAAAMVDLVDRITAATLLESVEGDDVDGGDDV